MRRPRQSPQRVLFVDDGHGLWGAQRYALHVAPFLLKRGISLGLLSPAGSDMAAAWSREGIGPTFSLGAYDQDLEARNSQGNLNPRDALRTAVRLAGRGRRVASIARHFKADMIIANSFWSHFDATLAGRLTGRRVIIYAHEECPPGLPALATRFVVRLASQTICVSEDVASSLGVHRKVSVVANGIDLVRFSPGPADPVLRAQLAASPQDHVVVVLCRLDPAKQVEHVIRAVANLEGALASTQLAVIGNSTTDSNYADEIRSLGVQLLGDRVRFIPARDDVPLILRSADLYVLAGRREGMPLGVLEAQATGCPVIAYPAAGVRNSVIDGASGLLAKANDWTSLSEKIALGLSDETLRESLSQQGRRVVESKFDLTLQAEKFADLVASV